MPGWRNGRRYGLNYLSTRREIYGVNGVKFGETLTGFAIEIADGNAELRLADNQVKPAKCRDETAPS
jgi:hypothetical protein